LLEFYINYAKSYINFLFIHKCSLLVSLLFLLCRQTKIGKSGGNSDMTSQIKATRLCCRYISLSHWSLIVGPMIFFGKALSLCTIVVHSCIRVTNSSISFFIFSLQFVDLSNPNWLVWWWLKTLGCVFSISFRYQF